MESVRVGVIGLGNMGCFHAAYLAEGAIRGARLTAVADANPDCLARYPAIATFLHSEDLIRSGRVDAVIVATPHFAHTPIGRDALAHGLHVLVEKPVAVHLADAQRLLAAHTDPTRVLAVMLNQRTLPAFQQLKALIARGDLGAIRRILWVSTDWFRTDAYYASSAWRATWRGEGGGLLINQCPHQLDLLQWLCGMPARVRAFCGLGKHHPIEVEDEVTAYLEYPSGATGVFIASTGEYPGTNRLEIVGDGGRAVVEHHHLTLERNSVPARAFSRTSPEPFGVPAVQREAWDYPEGGGTHQAITQNFVDAILQGAPLIAPAAEGLRSLELANAMLYAHFQGAAVELPLDAAAYEAHLEGLIAGSQLRTPQVPAGPTDVRRSFR
ncbi:MAG: Gfo/Idh/MocA family protein [Anaerolineae bacterium]